MTDTSAALLIVDHDPDAAQLVAVEAAARGHQATVIASTREALELVGGQRYDALLVDLAGEAQTPCDLVDRLKALSAATELIVLSSEITAASIPWCGPEALTVVRKTDLAQLFAILARALERRRIAAENRRLLWELKTINEISTVLTRSLDLDEVIAAALQRLMTAMEASGGSVRLRDEATGSYGTQVAYGSPALRRWLTGSWPGVRPLCDDVVATRTPVIVAGLASGDTADALPVRSAISVPLCAATRLLGTLTLASDGPRRFDAADQQLLAIIAGQMVIAVENAQLHQTIRRAKREWEQTFDAISDPIAVFNDAGELLRGNRALAAHLALPITAIRGLTCRQVGFCGGEESCDRCAVARALKANGSRGEVTAPDGQIFSVTTFPISTPSKGPSVVQVAKNVTEEIRGARRVQRMSSELTATNERLVATLEQLTSAQARLVQAEKLSAIGQLVSGVAHELNNPLTSVIGYAQLAEEELRQQPGDGGAIALADDMRRIADESERAARIVRNLLAFARTHSGARERVDARELCSKVLSARAPEFARRGIHVTTRIEPGLPPLAADPGQLQQVLLNLVLNAEQAMRLAPERRLTIAARFDIEAGAVDLSVSDSGHGIARGDLSRIFDPFFTTREVGEGTGLGLSICYGIVRDHGGEIRVESEPNAGTTFHLVLPALSDEPAVRETEVLVAHSEPGEREFMAAILAGWGYRTVRAASVREALDAYRRPTVGVAVVDARLLAEDLDAWRAHRATGGGAPVVVASTQPENPAVARFSETEAVAVVVVPIEMRALRGAVRMSVKECV